MFRMVKSDDLALFLFSLHSPDPTPLPHHHPTGRLFGERSGKVEIFVGKTVSIFSKIHQFCLESEQSLLTKGQSERFLAHVNFAARVPAPCPAEAFMNGCSSYEPSSSA